jgi:hypothetical protein
MPFEKGNHYGSLSKRGKNKVNASIKEKLQYLAENILNEIELSDLNKAEKITLLKSILPYVASKNITNGDEQVVEKVSIEIIDPKHKR